MKRTVLVTGAAGFIGADLSQRLLQQGHRVVGVDNLNTYYFPALKQARLRQIEAVAKVGNWRSESVALEDGEALMELFSAEQPQVVSIFLQRLTARSPLKKLVLMPAFLMY